MLMHMHIAWTWRVLLFAHQLRTQLGPGSEAGRTKVNKILVLAYTKVKRILVLCLERSVHAILGRQLINPVSGEGKWSGLPAHIDSRRSTRRGGVTANFR